MKIIALREKSGAYEIRQTDEKIFGGIIIDGKNRGVGFVGKAEENQYLFEFEDGIFSKSVKIFYQSKDNQIGRVDLGFTDSGTLEVADKTYEWQALSSSKIWLDADKNVVMFLDLEHNAETSPNILISDGLETKAKDLLVLAGWYLLIIEWRTGLTNSKLAGMPVKTDDFQIESSPRDYGKDWFDVLIDVATKL